MPPGPRARSSRRRSRWATPRCSPTSTSSRWRPPSSARASAGTRDLQPVRAPAAARARVPGRRRAARTCSSTSARSGSPAEALGLPPLARPVRARVPRRTCASLRFTGDVRAVRRRHRRCSPTSRCSRSPAPLIEAQLLETAVHQLLPRADRAREQGGALGAGGRGPRAGGVRAAAEPRHRRRHEGGARRVPRRVSIRPATCSPAAPRACRCRARWRTRS